MVNQQLISQITDLPYCERERDWAEKAFHPLSYPCTHTYCFLRPTPITIPMSRARRKCGTPHESLRQDPEQQLSSNPPQFYLRHHAGSHLTSPHVWLQSHCHCWTWHITEKIFFLACCFNYIILLLISNLLNLYVLLNQKADCHFEGHLKHVSCYLSFLIQYQEVHSSLQCQTPSHTS